MDDLLVLGHSHLHALKKGYKSVSPQIAKNSVGFFDLQQKPYLPLFSSARHGSKINSALKKDLTEAAQSSKKIVSAAFGNEHNVIGLVNHPRPFDFILNTAPELSLNPDFEPVPEYYVREMLRGRTNHIKLFLKNLRAFVSPDTDIYHVQSPPPIPSEKHIFENARGFAEKIAELGVSPQNFRLKLWKLYSEIVKDYCLEDNIIFLPVPDSTIDSSGFLDARFWSDDATHGNAEFGHKVVENILHKLF